MKKPEIHPENSAQGRHSKSNPLVQTTLELLMSEKRFGLKPRIKLVDLGCGRLRHLDICTRFAKHIILVDTARQIEKVQKFGDATCTMSQYVEAIRSRNCIIEIRKIDDFEVQDHYADVVLSIAVMDVVLKEARTQMTLAAYQNLRPGGYFVVIVPRNDSSILVNCRQDNRYQDGFVFRNRGHDTLTFYTNYRDPSPLIKLLTDNGFALVEDLSVFRQICLILQKPL